MVLGHSVVVLLLHYSWNLVSYANPPVSLADIELTYRTQWTYRDMRLRHFSLGKVSRKQCLYSLRLESDRKGTWSSVGEDE